MLFPNIVERTLLGLVVAISIWLFWLRFHPVLERIRRAREDADFKLHPVSRRLWFFITQVLCQAKVIRQRPLPGIAHALVFWGFCAFALVTLNHVATGFGLPLFERNASFGAFYWWFAFIFAAAVAVAAVL
jgi:hypothetical protein